MQALALKIALLAAIMVGACVATWFKADAYYSQKYTSLKAQYEQAAKDQEIEKAKLLATYAHAAQEVNDEAKYTISGMSVSISDLGMRLRSSHSALSMCTSTASAGSTGEQPNGPATAASVGAVANPQATIGIDANVLASTLDTAIDAIEANVLWRKYARETGQVQ